MTRALRLVSFAIAVAGIIDPAFTLSGASRPRVAVLALRSAPPAAADVRERLVRDLSPSCDLVPYATSDAAAAIVIGDRYPDGLDWPGGDASAIRSSVPDGLPIASVTIPDPVRTGVRIVRIDAPAEVPPATVIHLDVELEGRGVVGQTTGVSADVAGLEAGRASHRWTQDDERWRAGIDVVPIGAPPYVVQVRLPPSPSGFGGTGKPDTTETADAAPVVSGFSRTSADVVVDVRRDPLRVQFYDARPSWAATFVRRALEADGRFQVATLSQTSRGVSAQTGGAVPLGDPRLDGFDVVVVGGLDRLSANDARSLDRYARERGGAVVVLPDQRIDAGPARVLVEGHELIERLLEQPATLAVTPPAASLRASELLVLRALMPATEVIARVPGADASAGAGAPVIVSMPRGDGRLLLSGAMDAWRYRASDNGAFDRFWQSTIAGLALAVPPPIAIDTEPRLLRPGERAELTVRVRSRAVASVSASLDRDQPIRLLPDPQAGQYRGCFVVRDTPGRSSVEVQATGTQSLTASRTVLIQSNVHRVRQTAGPALGMLASSHRGIDVAPERLEDLRPFLRDTVAPRRAPLVRHPMRSTWWIVPFALCLTAEWWLRRRRGLR
jgi:hypothetical protein